MRVSSNIREYNQIGPDTKVLLTLLKQGEVGKYRLPDLLAKTAGISPAKATEVIKYAKHRESIELTNGTPAMWRITPKGRAKCTTA